MESMSDEDVQAEVMAVVRSMYPNKTIPQPKGFYFYRWGADPLFRGSFTNWPASYYVEQNDNLRARLNNVVFAGEGTSNNHYGYLHGAYMEGERVGQLVAQWVATGIPPDFGPPGGDVPNFNKPIPA